MKAQPSVRPFGVAAVLALVGAALLVGSSAWQWPQLFAVFGGILIALGVALIAAALVAASRQGVTVVLDEVGFSVQEPGGVREGTWEQVTRVTAAPGRLTLHLGDEQRFVLLASESVLKPIASDIAKRLDHNRGYTNFN